MQGKSQIRDKPIHVADRKVSTAVSRGAVNMAVQQWGNVENRSNVCSTLPDLNKVSHMTFEECFKGEWANEE